jgi:hypothetical protein
MTEYTLEASVKLGMIEYTLVASVDPCRSLVASVDPCGSPLAEGIAECHYIGPQPVTAGTQLRNLAYFSSFQRLFWLYAVAATAWR